MTRVIRAHKSGSKISEGQAIKTSKENHVGFKYVHKREWGCSSFTVDKGHAARGQVCSVAPKNFREGHLIHLLDEFPFIENL
jgi:hypothetical protein